MRIVILSETYSKKMGYSENCLTRALARAGADVHLVTLGLPPYYGMADFQKTYGSIASDPHPPGSVEEVDGYTVHYLGHQKTLGYMRFRGLLGKLRELKPDVVQTFSAVSWIPMEAALYQPLLGYKLYTASHTTASVFPLAQRESSFFEPERLKNLLTRVASGRMVSLFTEKCYPATVDCADVAVRFFGVPRRLVEVSLLGVDTDLFFPIRSEEDRRRRAEIRAQFGVAESEIACIYTGRFTKDKNPALLAQAVAMLRERGHPVRGIFVGDGVQADEIRAQDGCVARPFVPFTELAQYFRAADIGVWPTQESMSMLDAVACGIPVIGNHTIVAMERIEGNGLTYRLNDREDLAATIVKLLDPAVRQVMGRYGADKIARFHSWSTIATKRLADYGSAVGAGRH